MPTLEYLYITHSSYVWTENIPDKRGYVMLYKNIYRNENSYVHGTYIAGNDEHDAILDLGPAALPFVIFKSFYLR